MAAIETLGAVGAFLLLVLLSAMAGVVILAVIMMVKECINYFKYKE